MARWSLWFLAFALALASRSVRAEDSAVDDSTVRVLTIGTVATGKQPLQGGTVDIAKPKAGHGTGFVIAPNIIMTAAHVVEGARHVVVRLPGDRGVFAAQVAYTNAQTDTAVLLFDVWGQRMPPPLVVYHQGSPRVRDTVYALGYPIDATRRHPQSSRGIVAGFLDNGTIQLDIAVNPGNSGGPLLDEKQRLVGMVIARGDVGSGVQGIGYAVPVAELAAAYRSAQRRIAAKEVEPLSEARRESADIVDELVHLRFLSSLRGEDFGPKLDAVLARVSDPDLLVYLGALIWNLSWSFDVAEPKVLEVLQITGAQARARAPQLRAFATRACRKALAADSTIGERSAFVALATTAAAPTTTTSYRLEHRAAQPLGVHGDFTVGPALRLNPAASSHAVGFAAAGSLAIHGAPGSRVGLYMGFGLARVELEGTADSLRHQFATLDLGPAYWVGSKRRLELSLAAGVGYYQVSMTTAGATVGDIVGSLRIGAAYQFGVFTLGSSARVFVGPTVWFEPINAGFRF